jgi:hypothetical protein
MADETSSASDVSVDENSISHDADAMNTTDDEPIEIEASTDFDKTHIPNVPLTESIQVDTNDNSAAQHLAELGVSAFNLEDVERNVIEQVDKAIEEQEKQDLQKQEELLLKIKTEIAQIEKVLLNTVFLTFKVFDRF